MASFPAAAPARVYVDVETTGFRGGAAITSAYHRVVQLSAVLGAPYDPDAAFDTLVNPNIHVPAASTAIHGIDDDAVVDAPTFDVAWDTFLAWVDRHVPLDHAVHLVAHNMFGFDAVVLARERDRTHATAVPSRYVWTDTLPPLRTNLHAFGTPDPDDPTPASLGSWYRRVTGKAVLEHAHNALADVRALRTVVDRTGLVPSTVPFRVPDTAPLTDVRYVRSTRALRLYDHVRRHARTDVDAKTVGALRAHVRARGATTPAAQAYVLERILRDVVNVFDDNQCEAIVAHVLDRAPHERTTVTYPYLKWPYTRLTSTERAGLVRNGWTTRGAVRDVYLYACAENVDAFVDVLVRRAGFARARAALPVWRT